MKKNAGRLSKKVFAAMMAGTMMTAMVGVNVSATDNSGVYTGTEIPISKTVTTDGNTYAPATTFNFSVQTASAGKYGEDVVYAGEENGLTVESGIQFQPGSSVSASYTNSTNLIVHLEEFDDPGIYHYTVSETIPDEEDRYEGIIYDSAVYDVYVYIVTDDAGTLSVGNVVSVKDGTKGNLSFTNDYGAGKENDSTHDVTITKDVTGNQGDRDALFAFNVSVNGATGEAYKILVKETSSSTAEEYKYTVGDDAIEVSIKDGGSIQIFGLSESDTYTVTEADYSDDGYTTKVNGEIGNTATGTLTEDGTAVIVENYKQADTPTGIAMTYGPYALMVALAGGMAVLFFRRRNREDY